jgi:hypothetical protein
MGRKRKVPPTPIPHPVKAGIRQVSEKLRMNQNSARWRELIEHGPGLTESKRAELREQLRKASKLPSVRKVGEMLRRLESDDEPLPAPNKKGRGGRPRILTEEQITEGIRLAREHSDLKVEATCELLRLKLHTKASNTVLWEHIIGPTRQNSGT